ncbi:MAG: ABC transporter substrate-binding protein [Alphaproteobacteria bacterium]|nr:ABC transporter substrate-binding protein [Alphaproteobacteria bacterium]
MLAVNVRLWRQVPAIVGAFVLCLSVQTAKAEPDVEAARAMIEQVGKEFLHVLGPEGQEDEQQLDRLIGLLKGAINLDTTGKLILARNWRTASDEQREAYLDLFRPYALDNLASKIRASSAEIPLKDFEIIKGEPVGKNDVLVSTDLFWPGYPPYRLDWRLRVHDDGRLQAIDVVVEGVSMVVTQRAEFASVIERRGFDGLLAQMRNQVKRQL